MGSYDYWLVKLNYQNPTSQLITESEIGTSVDQNRSKRNDFIAYPNPAKDVIYIRTNNKQSISLIDPKGKILISKTFNGTDAISTLNLSAGLYYLKNNNTGATQKVIITK